MKDVGGDKGMSRSVSNRRKLHPYLSTQNTHYLSSHFFVSSRLRGDKQFP